MSGHTKGRLAYMHKLPSGTFGDTGWNVQFLRDSKEAEREMAIHGGTVTPLVADPVEELFAARELLRDIVKHAEPIGDSLESGYLSLFGWWERAKNYIDACDTLGSGNG